MAILSTSSKETKDTTMLLKQEELLSKYFEHRMSADEEQNFLIQLAASDDLRTAFRSHLELQKAIRDDKDDLRSVAQVRNRTLTALGLSATAVTPFIERELMKTSSAERQPVEASVAPRLPLSSKLASVLRSRVALLTSGLVLGFASATAIFTSTSTPDKSSPAQSVTTAPATHTPPSTFTTETGGPSAETAAPAASDAAPARETIRQSNGLNTKAHSTSSVTASTAAPSTNIPKDESQSLSSKTPPTVTLARPGQMKVNAATVSKTPDSTTKE
jgi:hypothetical protein